MVIIFGGCFQWLCLAVIFESHFWRCYSVDLFFLFYLFFGGHFWLVVFSGRFWKLFLEVIFWWIFLMVIFSGLVCWLFLEVVFDGHV